MWIYEKKLEIPVRVSKPDLQMAKFLITQYGGPDSCKGNTVRERSVSQTKVNFDLAAIVNRYVMNTFANDSLQRCLFLLSMHA